MPSPFLSVEDCRGFLLLPKQVETVGRCQHQAHGVETSNGAAITEDAEAEDACWWRCGGWLHHLGFGRQLKAEACQIDAT